MIVECPNPECAKQYEFAPRPADWQGRLRRRVICPHCGYPARLPQAPAGALSERPKVFMDFDGRGRIPLQEYECPQQQAQHFANQFSCAWNIVPAAARQVVAGYWARDPYAPYVWVLDDRNKWGGRGWAAAEPGGMSLYFVAGVVKEIPDEHIRLFVAHEIGHTLFIALGESHHAAKPQTSEIACKRERLVWDLMMAWGLDQLAAEEWMERNFEDTANTIRKRDVPLSGAEYEGKCVKDRERIEAQLATFPFPAEYEQYRVTTMTSRK